MFEGRFFTLVRLRAVELVDEWISSRRPVTDRRVTRAASRLLRANAWVSVVGRPSYPAGVRVWLGDRDWSLLGSDVGEARRHLEGALSRALANEQGTPNFRVELARDGERSSGFALELLLSEVVDAVATESATPMSMGPPATEAFVRIALVDPNGRQLQFPLGSFVLGRAVSGAGRVECDARVSATHATLTVHDDIIEIADLGSTNGTWVDGRRIQRARLVDGSVLQIGRTRLCVRDLARRQACGRLSTMPFSAGCAEPS